MFRALRLIFLVILGVALLVVAFANRQVVTLHLLPADMATFLGRDWSVELPLFLIIFAGIVAGLGIGFVWEWFREAKHRTAATTHRREASKLQREVSRLREKDASPTDDVLALLEGGGRTR
jgi:lipopolysaccharide assembly protein A